MSDPSTLLPHEIVIRRLKNLGPYDTFVYFRGFLEEERVKNPQGPAEAVGSAAHDLMANGVIHLTQRRISPPQTDIGTVDWRHGSGRGFEYIATGAVPPKKPMRWS